MAAMSERTRKQAFAVAVAVLAAAAAILMLLGSSRRSEEERSGGHPTRTVVAPTAPRLPPVESDEVKEARPPSPREARATASRFAVAYLARESGNPTASTRRVLRATSTGSLWARLRAPVRPTPAWRPPPSRFEEVSGLSEGLSSETLEATIAYRRDGRLRFLSVVMVVREGGWRALRVGQ